MFGWSDLNIYTPPKMGPNWSNIFSSEYVMKQEVFGQCPYFGETNLDSKALSLEILVFFLRISLRFFPFKFGFDLVVHKISIFYNVIFKEIFVQILKRFL